MPVPSSISDLSQTAASNSPAGSESPNTADDYLRTLSAFIATLRDGKGLTDPVTLASAATTDIGAQNALFVEISGTGPITSFGSTYNGPRFLRFTGALTLTHNATTLNLPGSENVTTEAGDTCIAIPNITPNGWNVVHYQKAALAPGAADSATNFAADAINSLTTVTLDSAADYVAIADGSDSGNSKKALLPAATDAAAGIVELATDAEVTTGTDTARPPSVASMRNSLIVANSSESVGTGATKDKTGIPSWAKRVMIHLIGVSTAGASNLLIQGIVGGSAVTTGYFSSVALQQNASSSTTAGSTAGFILAAGSGAGTTLTGTIYLERVGTSNTWVASYSLANVSAIVTNGAGSKAFSGALEGIRLTSDGGSNFDAGDWAVSWE